MKRTLIIVTNNNYKLKEIKQILKDIPFKLKSLSDIGFLEEIKETGSTCIENAKIKAESVGKKSGYLTLGEDTALEIDYLQGKPGIYSARYHPGSDSDRIKKILRQLEGVNTAKRTARFISVVAIFDQQGAKTNFFQGESNGYITDKPLGKNGFGYDPIFYNSDLGKTNAQATSEEKNRVSHRARALLKAKEFLYISSTQ